LIDPSGFMPDVSRAYLSHLQMHVEYLLGKQPNASGVTNGGIDRPWPSWSLRNWIDGGAVAGRFADGADVAAR
jgi:hypothetical protein